MITTITRSMLALVGAMVTGSDSEEPDGRRVLGAADGWFLQVTEERGREENLGIATSAIGDKEIALYHVLKLRL